MRFTKKSIFLLFIVVLVMEFVLCMDLPAFWDAKSKFIRADWLFQNQFQDILVPTELNSGHPPLWILAIAGFWTVFGKAVWSARLLLLIVNIGVGYQLIQLGQRLFLKAVPLALILLVAIEPTLVAQTTNLNNDMLLLFFVLLGLNSLVKGKSIWYAVAMCGMLLTNLRGIYCFLALAIIHFIIHRKQLLAHTKKMYKAYLTAVVVATTFFIYQYVDLGWIIVTPNKTYAQHREAAGLMRIIKNTAAFGKNLLEYGRLFVWLPMIGVLLYLWKTKNIRLSKKTQVLLISLVVFMALFFIGMVPFSNPMGPRYFMICFILATVLFINLIHELPWFTSFRPKVMVGIVGVAFLTGHLWIYPPTIAQGWDSSLAYLNYYPQEETLYAYLIENNIPSQEVGTNLPLGNRWVSLAKDSNDGELQFVEQNLEANAYVLFSNLDNRTSDTDINTLQSSWEVVKHTSRMGVFLTLYKNPNVK
jgi:4-amino-4-deoxy-L-arabinose transferase-like glycosyltransferase